MKSLKLLTHHFQKQKSTGFSNIASQKANRLKLVNLIGITTLFISLLTNDLQAWRAANINPVKALRYE